MLSGMFKGILDLIYPKTCLLCKKDLKHVSSVNGYVCSSCWQKIKRNTPPFCRSCGRHLEPHSFTKKVCAGCVKKTLHFDRAFSPCAYEGPLKELIRQFKYQNKDYLGVTLSRLMIEFIGEYSLPVGFLDFIIPIPLHKTKERERDFNQAELLSKCIADRFNKPMLNDKLKRTRSTKTQTGLEESLRFLNVKGSFSLPDERIVKEKNILLVDDVLTTGATSSEAAYTLKKAGARIVFVLTLAN